jgi:hypothetical protein
MRHCRESLKRNEQQKREEDELAEATGHFPAVYVRTFARSRKRPRASAA